MELEIKGLLDRVSRKFVSLNHILLALTCFIHLHTPRTKLMWAKVILPSFTPARVLNVVIVASAQLHIAPELNMQTNSTYSFDFEIL